MKKLFLFLGIVLTAVSPAVSAQEVDHMPEISLDMRGSYRQGFTSGSGRFIGDELYLDINGFITPYLSYSLNHRIAAPYYGEGITGFDATNWLTLTYELGNFAFTAGKDALLVGSFEYDAYDLDSYYDMNSDFYNNFDCWQWGASVTWNLFEIQEFILQVANSPYSYGESGLFSYALAWRGYWDFYESYWTANLWQYDACSFTKALNAGNRFYVGNLTMDLDLMFRFDEAGEDLNGFTGTFAPSYQFKDWGRLFAKMGWDSTPNAWFFGGGFEYFPIKDYTDLRLHAAYTHNAYTIGDMINIGLTWKMNLTRNIRKILKGSHEE